MNGKISNFRQVASLRRYTVTEGSEKGLDIMDCDNGKLRFLLNVTKALDVMQLYHEGQNLSFVSKNGFTGRELPFLNRFEGGMLYTCGLDSVGGREGYEIHGTFHNTPATVIRAECNENGITVEAEIRSTVLFGRNLVMKRKVFSEIGGDTLKIEDTLVNESWRDEEYCLLYHVNIGYPMLDEGAKVIGEVKGCEPRNTWSNENMAVRAEISAPLPNEVETCYFLKLAQPKISLVNEKIGKTFTVSYSHDTLPFFVEWKSMACGDYALGLEPATTELDNRFAYKTLKAGESVRFALNFQVETK